MRKIELTKSIGAVTDAMRTSEGRDAVILGLAIGAIGCLVDKLISAGYKMSIKTQFCEVSMEPTD